MKDPDLTSTTPTAPEPYHAEMRRLGKAATKVFMSLIAGIPVGDAKRIDNARGAFMAVSSDYLFGTSRAGAHYAVAHRYEVNGDLIPDPDVEFFVVDDPFQPGAKAANAEFRCPLLCKVEMSGHSWGRRVVAAAAAVGGISRPAGPPQSHVPSGRWRGNGQTTVVVQVTDSATADVSPAQSVRTTSAIAAGDVT